MKATLISLFSVVLLSASANAQADNDKVPAPPKRTTVKKADNPQTPNGGEMCTIKIKGQEPVSVAPTCEGLQSKQTDLDTCMDIATDVCGVSRDDVKEAVTKRDPSLVKKKDTKKKRTKKKKPAKKPVKKKVTKKTKKPSPPPTLRRFNKEPKGTNCPEGGVSIHDGSDKNRNGKLEQDEVKTSYYVCNGLKGEKGDKGDPGVTTTIVKHEYTPAPKTKNGRDGKDGSRVNIGFGAWASALYAKDLPSAYAVGPALQLQVSLSPKWELTLDGGWAPGKDRATMVSLKVARYVKPWLFIETGPYAQWIGISGNYAKNQYVGLATGGGVRYTKGNHSFRLSATGFIGYEGFNLDDWRAVRTGVTGSAMYTHSW